MTSSGGSGTTGGTSGQMPGTSGTYPTLDNNTAQQIGSWIAQHAQDVTKSSSVSDYQRIGQDLWKYCLDNGVFQKYFGANVGNTGMGTTPGQSPGRSVT